MPNLVRNVLAVVAGIAIGGGVNMALVTVSPSLIPPPAGVDGYSHRYSYEASEQWCTED